LISTVMTRCIHCTRCVRFAQEVAGVPELGATGRGEHTEIGTYVEHALTSELSGNMIDLCPVGALTSKPYAFHARPWELKKTESVDVLDAVGTNIRVDTRGPEVMRILPRLHEDVNEEWLADKGRFACDGLKAQRLDKPYVRKDGKLQPASWEEAFAAVAEKVNGCKPEEVAAIAGDLADCESMTVLKDLMANIGSPNIDCRQDGAALEAGCRAGYLFNTTIAGIDDADALLLIGTNPRVEAPVLNARIRKRYLRGGFKAASVGPDADLTYACEHLGDGADALDKLLDGSHPFAEILKGAERPMVIVGQGALVRPDGSALLAAARRIAEDFGMVKDGWNGFNVLHTAAARVGGLDLGLVPGDGGRDVPAILEGAQSGAIKMVYLLGADEVPGDKLGQAFVVYQGHHGDQGAHQADVILPGAAYTEKDGTYVNTEGRVQRAQRAVFPVGEAKDDWAVLRAASEAMGKTVALNSLSQVRARMVDINPVFATVDEVAPAEWGAFGTEGAIDGAPLTSAVANYYQTDPISRASRTMAACTAVAQGEEGRTGTDG
jgi:NADH-quinone oxidoreductase subunit G